jgi:N-acetylmuramoyl-L-alanine amidase
MFARTRLTALCNLRRWALPCATALALTGCATQPTSPALAIDDSIQSIGHSSRVRYIVLHYTSVDTPTSLKILSEGKVSTHYLITDDTVPHIYRLVDEGRTAWHAGESRWLEQTALNSLSIGIELVNGGRLDHPSGKRSWSPYHEAQIQALTVLLRELIDRHNVLPENIVGHSDIAPQRKTDPGPLFPWKHLAEQGIGRWQNEAVVLANKAALQHQPLPSVAWFQDQLTALGYASPRHGKLDRATQNVIAAFQMHYRPLRYDGQPDRETAAILMALLPAKH